MNLSGKVFIAPDLPWPVYIAGEPELSETNSLGNATTHLEASDLRRGCQVQRLGGLIRNEGE